MNTTRTRPPRTAGDVVRGLAASLVVLGLLLGIPAALGVVAGSPMPTAFPSLDAVIAALMTPDDGTLFLAALEWVAWIGWATFALAVLVEVPAQIKGRPTPHLPALGVQQQAAAVLVAAIAVLITAPTMVPLPPAQAVAVVAHPFGHQAGPATAPGDATRTVTHEVQPGDTLWDISGDHLGDPRRYPEIVEATRPIVQPDGRQLTNPDLIYPGWQVHVPAATAPAPPVSVPPAPAPPVSPQTSGTTDPSPDLPENREPAASQRIEPPTPDAVAPPATESADDEDEDRDSDPATVATTTGIGALAAAGLIALVARKRSRQQAHRRPGQRLVMPEAAAAATERDLRHNQDPLTVEHLNLALRTLAASRHEAGEPLPPLRMARVLADRLELHLSVPTVAFPPFAALSGDDTMWWLDRDADLLDAAAAADVPCPYPALAPVGRDLDGGHVLLDLEELGALAVQTASDDDATAVLAALTVELATSQWADDLQVTLVGACGELPGALGVDRVVYTRDLDRLLVQLDAVAASLRTVFSTAGVDGPRQARSARVVPDSWSPHIVLLGVEPTPEQAERLQRLLGEEPRVPVAVVTTRGSRLGESALVCRTEENLATLVPDAVSVWLQNLPGGEYEQVLDLLRTAGAPPTAPGPAWTADLNSSEPTLAELVPANLVRDNAPVVAGEPRSGCATEPEPAALPSAADVAHEERTSPVAPTVRVLGTVEVTDARGDPPPHSQWARVTEAVAFLALHPHRDRFPFDEALWPGERVLDTRRNQLMSRARRWLGLNDDGEPLVAIVNPAGYRLADAVCTDWGRFRDLVGDSLALAPTDDLNAALTLVRGQPFAGTNPRRYGWADVDRQEMTSAVVDVAHEVARRAQCAGDAALARQAAAIGLRAERGSELLWRDALRAEWLAGNRQGLEQVADRLTAICEELGSDPDPDTLDVLDELLRRRALGRVNEPPPAGGTADDH